MEYRHEGQAEWDGRQAYMERLHHIILECHKRNFKRDFSGWFSSLLVLKIELSSHIRTEEERELTKNSFNRLKSAAYNSRDSMFKLESFIGAQESLHRIMRNRGFDVPINDHSPGKSTR